MGPEDVRCDCKQCDHIRLQVRAEEAEKIHRDLTRRLGFGDDITEPMADNDTIVRHLEQRDSEASEWVESQLWRNDCYAAGHPQDDDCHECDPILQRLDALAAIERVRALHHTKDDTWCATDGFGWPCPTIKALDGDS